MANYNGKSGKRWAAFWTGATAFIIIMSVLAGLIGWRTSGYKDWTFGFGAPTVSTPDDKDKPDDGTDEIDTDNSFLVSTDKNNSLMRLAVTPTNAIPESYTITATVKPDNATIKDVDWALKFKDASSAWASGKNCEDFVVLSTSLYGGSATIRCKAAFGEQIILTATAKGTPTVTANCTLDYVKRVENTSITFNQSRFYIGEDVERHYVDMSYTLGVGTLEGTFVWEDSDGVTVCTTADLTASTYYEAFYKAADAENPDFDDVYPSFTSAYNTDEVLFTIYDSGFAHNDDGTPFYTSNKNTDNLYRAMVYEAMGDTTNNAYIEILYSYTYNGTKYNSGRAKSGYFTIDVSEFYVDVSDLDLSNGSIIF